MTRKYQTTDQLINKAVRTLKQRRAQLRGQIREYDSKLSFYQSVAQTIDQLTEQKQGLEAEMIQADTGLSLCQRMQTLTDRVPHLNYTAQETLNRDLLELVRKYAPVFNQGQKNRLHKPRPKSLTKEGRERLERIRNKYGKFNYEAAREIREKVLKLTRKQACKRYGLAYTTLSDYENGWLYGIRPTKAVNYVGDMKRLFVIKSK